MGRRCLVTRILLKVRYPIRQQFGNNLGSVSIVVLYWGHGKVCSVILFGWCEKENSVRVNKNIFDDKFFFDLIVR